MRASEKDLPVTTATRFTQRSMFLFCFFRENTAVAKGLIFEKVVYQVEIISLVLYTDVTERL